MTRVGDTVLLHSFSQAVMHTAGAPAFVELEYY
jgi:hypothetical protein